MVSIVFAELELWAREYVKKKLKGHALSFIDGILTSKNAAKANADIICPFVGSKIDKEAFQKMPKVRCVATMSTGFDHIDLGFAKKKGIVVSNVPAYGDNTVAQHACAHLFNISKKFVDSVESTRKGTFNPVPYRGFDLKGKTLGIIGTGRIGLHMIQMCQGFEMNIIAFDVFKNMKASKQFGYTYVSLPTLLKTSDVISIHVPLLPATTHLINKKAVVQMKQGAVIINTSRGPVIDTDALLQGLESGKIGAAGLDVLEGERDVKAHKRSALAAKNKKLLQMPNVYVTPHSAYNTNEAIMRIIDTTIDNIRAFLKGKPANQVN